MSICFLSPWNTGFFTNLAALWLLQYILVALSSAITSNLLRNHLVDSVSAMYLASVLEVATVSCFLDSQDITPFDSLNTKPVLDFLSSISPLQSELTYPVRSSLIFLNHGPMLDIPINNNIRPI